MTGNPRYYFNPDLEVVDDIIVGIGADAFFDALGVLINGAPAGIQPLYFVVKTLGGAATEIQYNATFDGNGHIVIDDVYYEAAATGLVAALVGAAVIPAGYVLAVATATTILTNVFSEPLGGLLEWIVTGEYDMEFQLADGSGTLIGGAVYDTPIDEADWAEAVGELLTMAVISGDTPVLDWKVNVTSDSSATPIDEYEIYGGSIALRASEIFFGGDIESFKNYSGGFESGNENGRFYAESGVHRYVYARDHVVDPIFPEFNVEDFILVPGDQHGNPMRGYHPSAISYAINGVFSEIDDSIAGLYLGDQSNSEAVNAGSGDDWMYGGAGDDEMHGSAGSDHLFGDWGALASENNANLGNDTLVGGDGEDYLYGGKGNDTLDGGTDDDIDRMWGGEGNDVFIGRTGEDYLHGEDGSDTANYSALNAFLKILTVGAPANNDYTVDKYYGQTSATGNYERDHLYSIEDINWDAANGFSLDGAGGEIIHGLGIVPPNTYAYALQHPSDPYKAVTLLGSPDGENVYGGSQADYLDGNSGTDYVFGKGGNDLYVHDVGDGNDWYDDQHGSITDIDTLWIRGADFASLSFARYDADTVKITAGGDTITLGYQMMKPIDYIRAGGATVSMETVLVKVEGTSGNNTLIGTRDNGVEREGALIHDEIRGYGGNDYLYGGAGSDKLWGGDGVDYHYAGTGADKIWGGAGADWLYGEEQDDELYGEAGNDTLYGGDGNDRHEGGADNDIHYDSGGNDVYVYTSGADTIQDTYGTDTLRVGGTIESTTVTNNGYHIVVNGQVTVEYFNYASTYIIENIEFSDGSTASLANHASWIKGTSSGETLNGTSGVNTIIGYDGADTVNALAGADQVFGGAGADTLYGGSGADIIYGGADNDIIEGGDDGDIIYGGAGSDNIKGNAGVDTFVFLGMGDAGDIIQDFNAGIGEKLDISDILTGFNPATDDITDFVQITDNGTNSFLSIDVDGGGDNFVQLATIYGTGLTDEQALLNAGNLVVV